MAQRPLDPNQDSVFVGLHVVESMAESVDVVAAEKGLSRSAVIREAVAAYLERQGVAATA